MTKISKILTLTLSVATIALAFAGGQAHAGYRINGFNAPQGLTASVWTLNGIDPSKSLAQSINGK